MKQYSKFYFIQNDNYSEDDSTHDNSLSNNVVLVITMQSEGTNKY